ncbi:MAG: hypothetical protein BRC52_08830 [Cyanobacteria bacterium SW_5_48_44]|nr:MAG: hypothetical protein BRC52_08830 [Cyanobacteria bacterium SW_5_48_44]
MDRLMGPIVVGGVGGSGTRVVAEILSKFGFYLGNDLNGASDNLLYTLLFKRPRWFYRNFNNSHEISKGINLFYKLMFGHNSPSLPELIFLTRAIGSMSLFGHNLQGGGRGLWFTKRIQRAFAEKHFNSKYIGWGWKEPNSHLLIEHLAEHFTHFKYIHTIRHGLDMAFSKNQQQLYNWGKFYNIKPPKSVSEEPKASLKYWIGANKRVFDLAKKFGENRILIINYDNLCVFPESGVQKLLDFLGLEAEQKAYSEAICLPRVPYSKGRYKLEDISQFDNGDLLCLEKLGFTVE